MFNNKKVVVVMPAYNAENTLIKTYIETIEQKCVDLIIIVDDNSTDNTVKTAKELTSTIVYKNHKNLGYGGNQKKCYELALKNGADIVIMVHPDYQYTPKLIPAIAALIGNEVYECVLCSRILGGYALKGGMPLWRYLSNRLLTFLENLLTGAKLSEYHTGYRGYSRKVLQTLSISEFSDDFIFDNQILCQILWFGCHIAEISCPTKYFPEASSISFKKCLKYGLECLFTGLKFWLAKRKIIKGIIFDPSNRDVLNNKL